MVNPATEEVIAAVSAGIAGDADRAVTAARRAFRAWSAIGPAARAKYLTAFGDAVAARSDEHVALISAEVGMPRKLGAGLLVQGAVTKVAAYTEESQRYAWEEPGDVATVVRQTVGVVAAITPSNVPLGIALDKVVPALLAVVLKPSEGGAAECVGVG